MRFTIFISFFSLTMIMILVFGKSINSSYNKKTVEQKLSNVQTQCNMLANQVIGANFFYQENSERLGTEIDQLANVLGGRIIVVGQNFKVLKDSYTLEQGKFLISEEVIKTMRGEKLPAFATKDQYAEVITPIISNDTKEVQGVIVATISMKDIESAASYLHEQSTALYTLFFVLSFAIALGLSILLSKNFKQFTRSIHRMANGHIDKTISIRGYTEMQDMVNAINEIITKMQSLENTRQEFVSNVSHELKTPITSMKVLADSLVAQEDVPNELYREFMLDIVDEIDRENKIINDLLALVKMDKKASDLNITTVNINELLELLLKRLRPLATKRNIEIVFESFRLVSAEIDEVKLSLAISNLIENAIKYNKDNGWIRVSLNADHKYFFVKVADSGVGIPEDCQDQIFERFYRVDKARSRETGGTGLGLSITRNAILMHKGAIKVYSKEGEGTTFTIRIPLTYII